MKKAAYGGGPSTIPMLGGLARFALHAAWGGSFVPRQALVFQKAPVGWSVHQGTAFLTSHVIRGCSTHGDFVVRPAVAFMRSCEPFYELGPSAQEVICSPSDVDGFGASKINEIRCARTNDG
jgi:hypothetical protein